MRVGVFILGRSQRICSHFTRHPGDAVVWIADATAPNDAGVMAAPGEHKRLVEHHGGHGCIQRKPGRGVVSRPLTNLAPAIRPVTLRFLRVDDDATVYLNGHLGGATSRLVGRLRFGD